MTHRRPSLRLALLAGLLLTTLRADSLSTQADAAVTLYEGARLIAGDGGVPIEDSAFLVENARFTRVGRRGAVQPPPGAGRVDLTGKTVIPGLVDAHSHIGYMKDLTSGAMNYTRDNILDHLRRFAYFGVVASQAMGSDFGELPFELRAETMAGKHPDAARFLTAGRGLAPLEEINADNMTQLQLGYTQCPCVKVPYVSDGMPWNNQRGVDNIAKLIDNGTIKDGDQVMGFSLGVQVVSLYLAQHRPPPGIRFLLVGDTFARNQELVNVHQGVPWDIENDVTMIVNQYDGWSDKPDVRNVLGYNLAANNASQGANRLHNYAQARLDHPANVVTQRGNIRHILVPTQKLPNNGWMRDWGNNPEADRVDAIQRSQIDAAYDRPGPTAEQLWAAGDEQVGMPPVPVAMRPEPVANVN